MSKEKKSSNKLLLFILVGILLGAFVGGLWPDVGDELHFIGDLFLNALKMLVVPLVIVAMITGITRLGDVRRLGGIGGRTITYYMATTAFSVLIGIILVNIVQPGKAETKLEQIALRGGQMFSDTEYTIEGNRVTLPSGEFKKFDDRYRVLLLDQEVSGTLGAKNEPAGTIEVTEWRSNENEVVVPIVSGKGLTVDLAVAAKVKAKEGRGIGDVLKDVLMGLVPKNLFKAMAETQILPLIMFALIFGAVLTMIGERGRPVIAFFDGANEAIMMIVRLLMYTAPVGVGALVAGRLGQAGGFVGFWPELVQVGSYALVVIGGLLIHAVIVLPLILRIFAKRSVLSYFSNMAAALTTAFSTASSSATLPVTIRNATERNKISERTSGFVLPLGATINMDGTAMYEAVAAIFIANVYGIDLGTIEMIIIFLTATLAAIGAAGIPEAGLVTMVIVLQAVGLPIEGISLLLIIDWFLDRCRTTVNVWGDSVGAAVIDATEKEPPSTA